MNTAENEMVRWIPFHMTEVLNDFRREEIALDDTLRGALTKLYDLFHDFSTAEESSGKAWERLFLIVVIIRVMSRQFDNVILPLDSSMDYSISFNKFFRTGNKLLASIVDVDEFVACLTKPDRYPHVEICQPINAAFAPYDLIVAVYDSEGIRKMYAYELKEGREIPDNNMSQVKTEFEACILIRGQSQNGQSKSKKQWVIPSKSQINKFFGESGKHWTPEECNKLMACPPSNSDE